MKRLLAGAIAATCVWAMGPVAEAHRQPNHATCGVKDAEVRYANPYVSVVSRETYHYDDYTEEDSSLERWYACMRRTDSYDEHRHGYRKRRHIASHRCEGDEVGGYCQTGYVEMSSWRLAFVVNSYGYQRGLGNQYSTDVRVLDVKTGRQGGPVSTSESIADLEVASNGTAVWFTRPPPYTQQPTYALTALTLTGENPVLDEGPELSDLAVSASTAYWKNAGEVKSAQVP